MEDLKQNIISFFEKIKFVESTHKYSVDGINIKMSVSKLIDKYKFVVNWDEVLKASSLRKGKTEDEVKAEWDKAAKDGCDKGNFSHIFGEHYPFNRSLIPQSGQQKAIAKFWKDLPEHIVPMFTELRMYHKKYLYAGTADIILYNTITGEVIIGDYKTNKDLYKNFKGNTMILGFERYLCNPLNHYQLQLSFYQLQLEQVPGVKVASRKIIWLMDDGTYQLIDTDDNTAQLNEDLLKYGLC